MADLRQTRNQLRIAIAALVLVDILALVVLFTPLGGSAEARQAEMSRLNFERKQRATAPWRGLDKKIPLAQKEIDDFYRDRLPGEDSAISADLGKLASETGVKVSSVKYTTKDAGIDGLQKIEIAADLSGDYLQLMRFVNALERNKLFFLVDDVELGSEQNGIVKLQIELETYLRTV